MWPSSTPGPNLDDRCAYRETRSQIERHQAEGILTVEMEAAALMALSQTTGAEVASLLHVTNSFTTTSNDFDKGHADIHRRVLDCCFEALAASLEQ